MASSKVNKTKRNFKSKTVVDPVKPEKIEEVRKPGEMLALLLTAPPPVQERELFGIKVSNKALENLTPQEIQDLHVVFEAIDSQQRGYLNVVELRRAMIALGFNVSRENAKQIARVAGLHSKNMLNFNEFLSVIIDHQGDSRDIHDEIKRGFDVIDYDGKGKFSLEDLIQVVMQEGLKFTKQELKDMFEEADRNGDGFVDMDEFTKIMLRTNLF